MALDYSRGVAVVGVMLSTLAVMTYLTTLV